MSTVVTWNVIWSHKGHNRGNQRCGRGSCYGSKLSLEVFEYFMWQWQKVVNSRTFWPQRTSFISYKICSWWRSSFLCGSKLSLCQPASHSVSVGASLSPHMSFGPINHLPPMFCGYEWSEVATKSVLCADMVKVVHLGRQFPIPLQSFRRHLKLILMHMGACNWKGKNKVCHRRRFNWGGTYFGKYTVSLPKSNCLIF